jgi:hypothetical protein
MRSCSDIGAALYPVSEWSGNGVVLFEGHLVFVDEALWIVSGA